ncbi:hypothetical protein I3000191B1_34700 [Flavonifractor plautii]
MSPRPRRWWRSPLRPPGSRTGRSGLWRLLRLSRLLAQSGPSDPSGQWAPSGLRDLSHPSDPRRRWGRSGPSDLSSQWAPSGLRDLSHL